MKNYIIEFIGTFFLVATIALTGNPLAIGAILMVMVYMGGPISGAHYNPAVSLAAIIRGKISSGEAIKYMLVQVVAAFCAALFYFLMTGKSFAPAPSADINILKPLAAEMLFTFALVMVVLSVATSKKSAGNSYYGLAIGFTVLASAFAAGPISGGAFNPAVGIGPILVDALFNHGSMQYLWLYIVGPFTGAVVAAVAYKMTNPDEFA